MAKQVTQYELLLSCPSDVKEELKIIKETVEDFNRMYGSANNISIVTKHWSTDSYPESGGKPQQLLNKQFVFDCDAAIAVFWTRFGTPTDEYGSGTEEEIEELIKSGKQVFMYFSDCPVSPSSINQDQYKKVLDFREKYKDKGIYWPYSSLDEFKKYVLNHLSLHFVRLINAEEEPVQKVTVSKLSVKGVVDGKINDDAVPLKGNYLNSKFMREMKDSISGLFDEVKGVAIPKKEVIKFADEDEDEDEDGKGIKIPVNPEIARSILGMSSYFGTSKVEIEEPWKRVIQKYASDQEINLNEDDFFDIGDLAKQKNHLSASYLYGGESYNYLGTDDEKAKYELLKELYRKIVIYEQYNQYFSDIDNKVFIELALSNLGTNFDEDVDIKVFIKKGLLCTKEQLPFPGDDILDVSNKLINSIYRPKKSVSVFEYTDYPPTAPSAPHIGNIFDSAYGEKVEANKIEYQKLLRSTFCYDYFQEGEYDIIRYNLKYIKQNTSILFPSFLVFNDMPNEIKYEISSKHCPDIVKGDLSIKTT